MHQASMFFLDPNAHLELLVAREKRAKGINGDPVNDSVLVISLLICDLK